MSLITLEKNKIRTIRQINEENHAKEEEANKQDLLDIKKLLENKSFDQDLWKKIKEFFRDNIRLRDQLKNVLKECISKIEPEEKSRKTLEELKNKTNFKKFYEDSLNREKEENPRKRDDDELISFLKDIYS
jgi:hypothetical protein